MSASIVHKSLAVVDADFKPNKGNKHKSKRESINNIIPEKHKLVKKTSRKGHKERVELLKTHSKLTVAEAKKNNRSKQEILKDNIRKLELIRQACVIDLDKDISEQIIERAVTRRPVKAKGTSQKQQKTAFTEEDFQKFEAEYQGE